ncbi:Lymphocyte transmembrane adapter 1 [Trebouxia sp. C0009 RCD-2024]
MTDQAAVAAFKEGGTDPLTVATKQGTKDGRIPIEASSLERLEEAEANAFEQTRGGGAYAGKWTGRWGKWQIGQIMLSMPNAFAKMGLTAGLVLSVVSGLISAYTIVLLVHLYEERKRRLILSDKWYGEKGASKSITQYHEVITFLCGRFLGAVTIFFVMLNVFGISVAQVIACSSDAYYWRTSLSKRTWALVFGAILQVSIFVPTLRHTRVINILGLVGTTYTVWWLVIAAAASGRGVQLPEATAGPKSLQLFYTGFGVLLVAYGGHNISFEVMDGMNVPKKYRWVGFVSFLYIFTLTVPHSTAVQLIYPKNNAKYGNVYGALPHTWGMNISIFLMILHQICAFIYYNAPLFYLWEKMWGIHEKSLWLRIPSRLPITLLCWLVGIAFPFYGTLNSVIGALCGPVVAFAMPAFAFNITYWNRKARQEVALSPFRWMIKYFGWNVIFAFNWFIIGVYVVNGTGFALVYSIKTFVQAVHQYKFFAECYQC